MTRSRDRGYRLARSARMAPAALGLILTATAGCTSGGPSFGDRVAWSIRAAPAHIVFPQRPAEVGIFIERVPVGAPVSVGEEVICLDHPGVARITSVEPNRGSGLAVDRFLVRRFDQRGPHQGFLGALRETLTHYRFGGGTTLMHACSARPMMHTHYELGMQLRRTGSRSGIAHGFVIHYVSRGQHGSLTVPMDIVLCPGATMSTGGFDDMCA